MTQLLDEWHRKKHKEDEKLHEQLRAAVLAGRVKVYTDPRVLDFPGSPVHLHWDHLAPLTGLMTLALIILLATNVVIGIGAMTVCTLIYLFGNRHYLGWRMRMRAQGYMLADVIRFQTLWQLGGVAMVALAGHEPPCLAPKGDWRKFIRRNLGEGDAGPRPTPTRQLPPAAAPVSPPAPPPPPAVPEPSPLADAVQPEIIVPPVPEQPLDPGPPRTHWQSIDDDEVRRDSVVPPPGS